MKNKIISELQFEIEKVVLKYESLFKNQDSSVVDFFNSNYNEINSVFAKLVTDSIHKSIISNTENGEDFILKLLDLKRQGFQDLIKRIKK